NDVGEEGDPRYPAPQPEANAPESEAAHGGHHEDGAHGGRGYPEAVAEPAPEELHERALLEDDELEVVEGRMSDPVHGAEKVRPRGDGEGDDVVDGKERPHRDDGEHRSARGVNPEAGGRHVRGSS